MTHIKTGHSVVVVPKDAPQVNEQAPTAEAPQTKGTSGAQTTSTTSTGFAEGLPPGAVLVLTQSGKDADRAAADTIRGANPNLYATSEVGTHKGDEAFRRSSDTAFHASSQPRSLLSHAVQAGAVAATAEVAELGLKASTLERVGGKTIFTWDPSKFTPRELGTQVRGNIAKSLERLKPTMPPVATAKLDELANKTSKVRQLANNKLGELANKTNEIASKAQKGATQAARSLRAQVPMNARVTARRGLARGMTQLRQAGTTAGAHAQGLWKSAGSTVVRGHTLQRWGARYFGIAKRGITGLGNSVAALPQRALNSAATGKVGQFLSRNSGKLMAGIPILGSAIAIHFAAKDYKHALDVEMDRSSPFGKRVLANLTSACSTVAIIPLFGLPAAIGGIASSTLERTLYPEPKASNA